LLNSFATDAIGYLHTWLAAETHLADGQLQKIAVNREEFLKLQGITGTPLVSK